MLCLQNNNLLSSISSIIYQVYTQLKERHYYALLQDWFRKHSFIL